MVCLSGVVRVTPAVGSATSYEEGLHEFRAGNYLAASRHFSETVTEHPDWDVGFMMLGWSDLRGGRPESAIEHLEKAVALNTSSAVATLRLGEAYANQGRYGDTLDRLSGIDVEKLAPEQRAELAQIRGVAFARTAQPEKALAQYEIVVSNRPDDRRLQFALGTVARKAGQLDRAVAAFRRCVELEPGNADALRELVAALAAQAFEATGESKSALYREAALFGRRWVELDRTAESLTELGGAELGAKSFVSAIESLRAAIALDERAFVPRYHLAKAHASANQLQSATDVALKAVELAADAQESALGWRLAGQVYEARELYAEAESAFLQAGERESASRVAQNADTARYNAEVDRENRESAALRAEKERLEEILRSLEAGEVPDAE